MSRAGSQPACSCSRWSASRRCPLSINDFPLRPAHLRYQCAHPLPRRTAADHKLFRNAIDQAGTICSGIPRRLLTSPFKAEKSGRVVVENVSLLLCGQVIGLLDRFDCLVNFLGPSHLVGAKHQPVPEAGANQGLDVPVKRRARDDPSDGCRSGFQSRRVALGPRGRERQNATKGNSGATPR